MAQLIDIKKVEVGPKYLTARVKVAMSAPLMTSEDLEGTTRIYRLMPHIIEHACLGDAGETFKDVMGDTEIAHLLEHVTVEILAQSDIAGDIPCGRTFAVEDERRTYEIEFPCSDDVLVIGALSSAVWILQWAYSGGGDPAPDVDATVDGLVSLVQSLPIPPSPMPAVREYVVEGDEARAILAELAAQRGEAPQEKGAPEPEQQDTPLEGVPAWMMRPGMVEEEVPETVHEDAPEAVAEVEAYEDSEPAFVPEAEPAYEPEQELAFEPAPEGEAEFEPEFEPETEQVEEPEPLEEPEVEDEPVKEADAEIEEEPSFEQEVEPEVESKPEPEPEEELEPEEEPEPDEMPAPEPIFDDEVFEQAEDEEDAPEDELGSTLVTHPLVIEEPAEDEVAEAYEEPEDVEAYEEPEDVEAYEEPEDPEEPEEHIPAPWTVR